MTLVTNRISDKKALKRQTILFFLHNFFVNIGSILVYVSANVLLLENHPEYSLPAGYIVSALLVMACARIYAHFEHHSSLKRLSKGTMLSALLLVVGIGLLLLVDHSLAAAVAIMAGYRVIYLLINLEFWGLSALVFDVRQSKKMFSVIGSGDVPAKALGAVLAVMIHSVSGLAILIPVAVLFFALAFYTQQLTFKYTEIPDPHRAKVNYSLSADTKWIRTFFGGNRLILFLCLGIGAIATAAVWIEYQFFINVKYKFHSQHDIIVFVGSLLTATYLIGTLVKVFLSSRIVERFGVRNAVFLLPVVTLMLSLGLLVSSVYWVDEGSLLLYFCIAYFLFEVVRRTIFDPVFLVMFQPLSTRERLAAHTLAKGFYEPLGMLVGGVILLAVFHFGWEHIWIVFDFSAVFSLGALFHFSNAYKHYVRELKTAIQKRFVGKSDLVSIQTALPVFVSNLASPRKEIVIQGIDWLAQNSPEVLQRAFPDLIRNPAVEVRLRTVDSMSVLPGVHVDKGLLQTMLAGEEHPGVQESMSALLTKVASMTEMQLLIGHDSLPVAKGAVRASIGNRGSQGLRERRLEEWLHSSNPLLNQAAIDVIATTREHQFDSKLIALLASGNDSTRNYLIRSIGLIGSPALAAAIKPFLAGHSRKEVLRCWVDMGDEGLPFLSEWLDKISDGRELKALVKALEPTDSTHHTGLLFGVLKKADSSVAQITLQVLAGKERELGPGQRAVLNSRLKEELSDAVLLYRQKASSDDLEWSKSAHFEIGRILNRISNSLCLLYDRGSIRNAWKGLRNASPERRANSLETLEHVLPSGLYQLILPFLEDTPYGKLDSAALAYFGESGKESAAQPLYHILEHGLRRFDVWLLVQALRKFVPSRKEDYQLLDRYNSHSLAMLREAAGRSGQSSNLESITFNQLAMKVQNGNQISDLERVILLKSTNLFEETPESVLSAIAPIMQEVRMVQGQAVVEKGEPGDSMYIILSGRTGVFDESTRLAEFGEGDIFGELALLDSEPRSATVVALTDVVAFRIDQEDFFELMDERDEVVKNILKILCNRIRKQNRQLSGIS